MDDVLDKVEHIEAPEFLKDDNWYGIDISADYLDQEAEWVKAKNVIYFDDAPVAILGGVTAITGQSGHGKTQTVSQIMAAILSKNKCYGHIKFDPNNEIENPTVLYIDTEMELWNTQRVQNRLYKLLGWTFRTRHEELSILRLRDTDEAVNRWRKTLMAIYEKRPTVMFLDGLLDVVDDFNNNVECQAIIYKCMKMASYYNTAVFCVVHENPGGLKMVGHLGSMLERKVVAIVATIKEKDKTTRKVSFTITQNKSRDKDAGDLKFIVEDDENHFGIPKQLDDEVETTTFDINQVHDFLEQIEPLLAWPASMADIKTKIKEVTGITNYSQQTKITEMAKNRNWLKAQTKEDWSPGQKAAKWYLDLGPF